MRGGRRGRDAESTSTQPSARGAPAPQLPGAAVESRWWYWIAAVPVVVAIWLVTFAWVALAVASEFGGGLAGGDPVPLALALSTLIAGVPLAVVGLLLPVATYMDARAVAAAMPDAGAETGSGASASADWRPTPVLWALAAAASVLTLAGAPLFALYYCYRRNRHLGVPGLEGGFRIRRP